MKHILRIFNWSLVAAMAAACHGGINEEIDDLKLRMEAVEARCNTFNQELTSLREAVAALENNDFVTNVVATTGEAGRKGYTIYFSKTFPITIYDGLDGEDGIDGEDGDDGDDGAPGKDGTNGIDGHSPQISVSRANDGLWYWVLDGKWMENIDGEKIVASAQNGVTPKLKIQNDWWYVSYDEGLTWSIMGKAKGEQGPAGSDATSPVKKVDVSNPYYVDLILQDGSIRLPRYIPIKIGTDNNNDKMFIKGDTTIAVRLPEGIAKSDFSAIRARVEYEGGCALSVVTKSGSEQPVEVVAISPQFDSDGQMTSPASVTIKPYLETNTVNLLEVTIVKSDGSLLQTARAFEYVSVPQYYDDLGNCRGEGIPVTEVVAGETKVIIWAPENLGTSEYYPSGLLYQWGRKQGQGYGSSEITAYPAYDPDDGGNTVVVAPTEADETTPMTNPGEFYFYTNAKNLGDWFTNVEGDQFQDDWNNLNMAGVSVGNPCPQGWRVPTIDEINALRANRSSWTSAGDAKGYWFKGANPEMANEEGVFLQACGMRHYGTGQSTNRGTHGFYWSATPSGTNAALFYFSSNSTAKYNYQRAYGAAIRCVYDKLSVKEDEPGGNDDNADTGDGEDDGE
ncbi:MAG: hypothetical protein HUJ91_02095 [Bacteroidales bacterium]|nr:hypothetical protein [Bacteroidales bacterium]